MRRTSKNRVPTGKMRMYHPPLNSTKSKVISNLVQSRFGSPSLEELESGIAPLVPRGFDPACWGLIHLPPPLSLVTVAILKVESKELHPKTLIEIAMVVSSNRGSFPSNSHVSATFSIFLRFGGILESDKSQKNLMLTGR